jgi:acyl dehydratase
MRQYCGSAQQRRKRLPILEKATTRAARQIIGACSGWSTVGPMSTRTASAWEVATAGHVVEAGAIRRMATALEDENPLWVDEQFARAHGHRSVVAPPTFVDSFNPFYAGEPYPVWPDDLPYSFSAGDTFVLHAPVSANDQIDVTCRIAGDEEKLRSDGSSRMRLVTYEKLYRRRPAGTVDEAQLVAEERWVCAFFEGARNSTRSAPAPVAEAGAEWLGEETREVTPLRIVRWASAVGDFERSHFDHRHAVDDCGLPDIVGHGPYSAAMLLKVVTDHLGTSGFVERATFSYRAASYPGDTLTFRAWRNPGEASITLVATKQDGSVVTTGTCTCRTS